ncbi:hypothetical protein [Maritalea sp. S77]|uniref:hypothetical protein n=1 Tax=Maritalea sp. S77 TaxID=3415125 RepID=UPI003C7AB645
MSAKHNNQYAKFIAVAQEIGCSKDEDAFDRKLKKIAKSPPPAKKDKDNKPAK